MEGGMKAEDRVRYSNIIHDESIRLTRLLDDLLDLSFLESGQVVLNEQEARLDDLLDRAVASAGGGLASGMSVLRATGGADVVVRTDTDRLSQVFINLISNAQKYCDAAAPQLTISVSTRGDHVDIDFVDNGSGIPRDQESGAVHYVPGQGGAAFRVSLPRERAMADDLHRA